MNNKNSQIVLDSRFICCYLASKILEHVMKFYTKGLLFHVAKLVLQTVAYNIKTQIDFITLLLVSDAHRYCRSPFSKDRNEET